ncbi:TraX family protein [Xanthomonas citri]|uniref:TraX family protein n=1 Tax=Xanthomonas citri TaxID=346 RepID=UPI000C5EA3D4|nr:TraX family protein [Xanthomonas citri]ATS80439.1 conjugal transfer protein [Xanthomonas citri pv. phaseoli var. fuscans]SOO07106.1 TraX family protein [Xanthomonas citri pv. fuscans]SOO16960.1 TraX family protein [Xanthomonas citri pv. fuscans]
MTSSGREFLKWIAVICMTCDHVATIVYGGHVPILSQLGRIAFPLFAMVMAYNLAQDQVDYAKSVRRLAIWGLIAQPVHAWAFGAWLPLNVLLTFCLSSALVWAADRRQWPLVAVLAVVAPLLVDYQWVGVWLVWAFWWWFKDRGRLVNIFAWYEPRSTLLHLRFPLWISLAMCLLCLYNANVWALLAIPLVEFGYRSWKLPRTRWAFYGYYVGHLALLSGLAMIPI